MTAPVLSSKEIDALIEYARKKIEVELYPYAPELQPVREALDKLEPKPKLKALAPPKLMPTLPPAKLRGGRRRR